MSSTKELRQRIKSIGNTSKVTKAMEMVSAAKMRRAQEQAVGGRSYSELINKVLKKMASRIDPSTHPLLTSEDDSKEAILLITTNRGLVGALNTNLFRKTFDFGKTVSFITLGKKGSLYVSKMAEPMVADFELTDHPNLQLAREISKFLINSYLKGEFNKISVIYTEFKSTLNQVAMTRQLLPIIDEEILEMLKEEENSNTDFLFEPNADSVLEQVLPHYVLMEIYQVLLEAVASEHSARMVAMKNATDNASELVDDLTLSYNQLRQANITNELLDITTAALALD